MNWDKIKTKLANLLILLMALAACVFLTGRAVRDIRLRIVAGSWPKVDAKVTERSQLREDRSGKYPTGSATFTYEYGFQGAPHTGKIIRDAERYAEVKDFYEKHPTGTDIKVMVNPENPKESVYELRFGIGTFGYLAGGIIAGILVIAMGWSLFLGKSENEEPESV